MRELPRGPHGEGGISLAGPRLGQGSPSPAAHSPLFQTQPPQVKASCPGLERGSEALT